LQVGAAKGLLELAPAYYQKLSQQYQQKRDRFCSALATAGFEPYIPQGAYYVLADISKISGQTSKERAMNLLHQTGIACVPGEAFYHDDAGDHLGRFCFAKEEAILDEACMRIEALGKRI
jgi:aminotransferase